MNETRLEELREYSELKAKEVAKSLNIAESTYSEWNIIKFLYLQEELLN